MWIEPYSNEYLTYEKGSGRYVLTVKAIDDNIGITLSEAVKDNPRGVAGVLNLVSRLVYKKIHEHAVDTFYQDALIATTETGRTIIFEAMLDQFEYMRITGDLSKSVDTTKRAEWFSDSAYEILLTPIPEIGRSVCYVGV